MFDKVGASKNFAIFTGKYWDYNAGVFMWILWNF